MWCKWNKGIGDKFYLGNEGEDVKLVVRLIWILKDGLEIGKSRRKTP